MPVPQIYKIYIHIYVYNFPRTNDQPTHKNNYNPEVAIFYRTMCRLESPRKQRRCVNGHHRRFKEMAGASAQTVLVHGKLKDNSTSLIIRRHATNMLFIPAEPSFQACYCTKPYGRCRPCISVPQGCMVRVEELR
ncbi:hypothetical protein LX36DRAFT_73180 [Colletotrichum falcatum]|nr:hypothetical protein LX36DRAFT_73180 [Colletotrichum falcatum]